MNAKGMDSKEALKVVLIFFAKGVFFTRLYSSGNRVFDNIWPSFAVALTARARMLGICDGRIKENIETFEVLNS